MPRTRNENFKMRLRADELEKLRALAEQRGETVSAFVRGIIRDRFRSSRRQRVTTRKEATR